ncbi:MAG: hypothetical protein E7507_06285 [Ruminococcus sp.]|nr:hypothetical protein [Ruminococcus sp.]
MIGITGDLHADLTRFKHKNLRKLKKNDYLIICGDFGCIWQGGKKEKRILKSLGRKRYNVLFVDGCHENYDILLDYPVEEWNGGKVRVISGKLRQLMRGEVYNLDGKRVFTFGGGQSDDKDIKSESKMWWKQEVPSEEEIANAVRNLEKHGNSVDYIITHEPPATLKEFLQFDTEQKSEMGAYFDELKSECDFKRWFFGKCHINRTIPPKYYAMFDDVTLVE